MATQLRILRRRQQKRDGHSVKCWKSKWDTCTCSTNRGHSKHTFG